VARSLFRGAPELSRLYAEAPVDLVKEFLLHAQFKAFVTGPPESDDPADDAPSFHDEMRAILAALKSDRLNLIEIEARRVLLLTEKTAEVMLRRLCETRQLSAEQDLTNQRDPVARSLWSYIHAPSLFEAAERAMQVRVYRDHGRLYEAWSIDASIPLAADGIDRDALSADIAARLHHDDGCKVEAVDLPDENGEGQEVLLAVTFFGPYASQKNVRPDKSTEILYYRPPDELLLVYSQARRRIEVCSRDKVERKLVAEIFAADTLKHDISNKPLTQKSYNLSRFRSSLKLKIPDAEAHRVRRACITEVQVALGDWSKRVNLSVAPTDDIDAIARQVFGAIIPKAGGGYVTKVRFHIEHLDGRNRKATLQFDIFGRNKSSIPSERDPAKRELGYILLESWGVLERVGDLSQPRRRDLLPQLLVLFDVCSAMISGEALDEFDIAADELAKAGFLGRKGWSDVILFEDDELGEVILDVAADTKSKDATLTLGEGATGPSVALSGLHQFEVCFDYIRDELRKTLEPLAVKGRVRPVADHVHQIGVAQIGLANAPIYLARSLSDDKILEETDRLIRGESNLIRGIIFVPREVRFPYLGSHVVLSLADHIDATTGLVNAEAVQISYEAAIDPAARGSAVHFRKQSDEAGQITVPGQVPRIVTGSKRVKLFERLYLAHRNREEGVKLAALKEFAGFAQLPNLFGDEWEHLNDRYIYSPRRGFWSLCEAPISV